MWIRRAACVLAVATSVAVVGIAAPASAQAGNPLCLRSINFAANHVDARNGDAVVALKWTVRNTDTAATDLNGLLKLYMVDSAGKRLGQLYEVDFRYNEQWYTKARWLSGTPQESTYQYDFVVPKFGRTKQALWAVAEVALSDELGHSTTVTGTALGAATLKATTLADSTAPSFTQFYQEPINNERPYVYVKDQVGYLRYYASLQDTQAGFWKGTLRLTGPGGQKLDTAFESAWFVRDPRCGPYTGGDVNYTNCGIEVRFPAGTASGRWTVTGLTLVDNVGNSTTLTTPETPAVTVTSNETVRATGFTATPNPVNNWAGDTITTLSFTVSGAQGGVTEVVADFINWGCTQTTTTPTVSSAGVVTIPVRFTHGTPWCDLNGLVVKDGAGRVAVYGAAYEAPATGLRIRQLPNTTPPTATEATLTPTTVARSQAGSLWPVVKVKVVAPLAPANGYSLYLYDTAGNTVAQQFGGNGVDADGYMTIYGYLPYDIAPGVYTYGFELYDESRLRSAYGPFGQPMPNGPLQLTVTDN
ncbi:hypothetical protein Cs7R123_66690 [Catellatospora sp. TT07R-123]|nr:hypothetical protein Cs7R123_66690 [Catellatospora sp. TT07R-123]